MENTTAASALAGFAAGPMRQNLTYDPSREIAGHTQPTVATQRV
ncbi:hypothetical protein [Macromonas bipunctata]|nr:hypothetical protein [Macromonas bipunctata]